MKLLLFTVIGRSYRNYTMFDEPIASLVLDSCLAFELQISNRKRRLNDLASIINKKKAAQVGFGSAVRLCRLWPYANRRTGITGIG